MSLHWARRCTASPHLVFNIAQATNFNIEIGGSEANTAVGLAQLGLQTTWLSRLTDNPLGRRITFDINYRSKLWSSNAASRWHRWPM